MAAHVIKDAEIFLGTRNMTGLLNQAALSYQAELQDDTVFGATARSRLAGLVTSEANVNGFWDSGADLQIFNDIGAAGEELFTICPEDGDHGDTAFFMNMVEANYSVGGQIGEIFPFSLGVMSDGKLVGGKVFRSIATNITTDENSSSIQLGAVSASQKVYCGMHILSSTGDAGRTLDVALVSDDNDNFSSGSTQRINMTQVTTSALAEIKSVDGAITDPYWRIEITVGGDSSGGTVAFNGIIVAGII